MNERQVVLFFLTGMGENTSGVPRTVISLASRFPEWTSVQFITWDSVEAQPRSLTEGELADFGMRNRSGVVRGPHPANVNFWLHAKSRSNGRPILFVPQPGPFIDHEFGEGTFLKLLSGAKDAGIQSSVLLYDLIPLHGHTYLSPMASAFERYLAELSFADKILTISEHVRQDLFEQLALRGMTPHDLAIRMSRVVSVHLGVDHKPIQRRSGRPAEKRILMLGTVEPRKRQVEAVSGFARAVNNSPALAEWRLDIVGHLHPSVEREFRDCVSRSPGVHYLGPLDDGAVETLLESTGITLIPSTDEGFGLPIVESMARGVPCIVHESGASAEVAGTYGWRADMNDPTAIASVIEQVCQDEGAIIEQREALSSYTYRTWSTAASEMVRALSAEDPTDAGFIHSRSTANMQLSRLSRQYAEAPSLTIAISTYNRKNSVLASLRNTLAIIGDDPVAILVLDNASQDGTNAAIAALDDPRIQLVENPSNQGMLGNLRRLCQLPATTHTWTLGDDDFITPLGYQRTCEVMSEQPRTPLIIHNFSVFSQADFSGWGPREVRNARESSVPLSQRWGKEVLTVAEVAGLHDNLFTAMYQFVWRADLLRAAFSMYRPAALFTDAWNSAPSAAFLLKLHAHTHVSWSGDPGICANAHNSWSKHRVRWHSIVMHEILYDALSAGVERKTIQEWSTTQQMLCLEALQVPEMRIERFTVGHDELRQLKELITREIGAEYLLEPLEESI